MCFLMLTSSLEVAKTKTKSIWFDKSALLNVQISALLHRMLSFCSFCSTLQPGFRTFANRYHVSPWWRITSSSWQVNCSDSTTHHEVNDPWYTCPSAVAASRNGISSTCQTNTGVGSIHQHLHFFTLLADRRSQSMMLLTPRTTSATSDVSTASLFQAATPTVGILLRFRHSLDNNEQFLHQCDICFSL